MGEVSDYLDHHRCKARHGQHMGVQCDLMVTELTAHACDHRAARPGGGRLKWSDQVAMYPAVGERSAERTRAEDAVEPASARQEGGDHYKKFKIQPWDIIDEYALDFYGGNALKYLLRAEHKGNPVQDLKKARHYLDKMLERAEADEWGE